MTIEHGSFLAHKQQKKDGRTKKQRRERERGWKSEKYCSLPFATALRSFSSPRTCLFIYLICMQLSSVECNENDAENKPNSHGITFIIRTFHSIGNKTQWQYYLLFSDQHASPCKSLEQLQFVQRGRVFIYMRWMKSNTHERQTIIIQTFRSLFCTSSCSVAIYTFST